MLEHSRRAGPGGRGDKKRYRGELLSSEELENELFKLERLEELEGKVVWDRPGDSDDDPADFLPGEIRIVRRLLGEESIE